MQSFTDRYCRAVLAALPAGTHPKDLTVEYLSVLSESIGADIVKWFPLSDDV